MGEDFELIKIIRTGTKEERDTAFDTLAKRHGGMIHGLCKRFVTSHIPLDDLKQSALLALWRATKWFDPSKGWKFSSYASDIIRHELLRHHEQLRCQKRSIIKFADSIDAIRTEDGFTLKATLADREDNTLEATDWLARAKPLLLQRLTPHQRQYLEAFLHGETQTEIAERFGYSRQRASETQRKIESIAAEVRDELDREPRPRTASNAEMPPEPTSRKPGRGRQRGRSLPSHDGKTPPDASVGDEGDG